MQPHSVQTFFLPDQYTQKASTIRAETFNLAHTLLNRTDSNHIFVPIRSMQYLAIIDGNDFWFVDSLAYGVNNNEGGRMIMVSWHNDPAMDRKGLNESVSMQVNYYEQDRSDIQLRLTGEFHQAMLLMDERYRDKQIPAEGARIIDLKRD